MKQTQVAPLSPANLALLDLGVVLGQTQAFGMIAGRCTAAQALGLKRLREEKLYKSCALTWEDFCRGHLKISKPEADRTIRLFDEFGPDYFDLSALTRISPETYRAIAPAVKDGAIHFNGEAIPLKPENSRIVSAAVAELRRTIQFSRPQPANPGADRGTGQALHGDRRGVRGDRPRRSSARGPHALQLGCVQGARRNGAARARERRLVVRSARCLNQWSTLPFQSGRRE